MSIDEGAGLKKSYGLVAQIGVSCGSFGQRWTPSEGVAHERTDNGMGLPEGNATSDEQIGEIPDTWNMLDWMDATTKLIHYTDGGPWFKEYEDHPHADVWYAARNAYRAAAVKKAA